MHDPVLAHLLIRGIIHLQLRHGCVDICRNAECFQRRLAGALWKEVYPQCTSASSSDFGRICRESIPAVAASI